MLEKYQQTLVYYLRWPGLACVVSEWSEDVVIDLLLLLRLPGTLPVTPQERWFGQGVLLSQGGDGMTGL